MLNFALPEDKNLLIQSLIQYHQTNLLPRYTKLTNYYKGKHDILSRQVDDGKTNNRIANPYPALVVDTVQGYLLGQPVKYVSDNEKLLADLTDILNNNAEEDLNVELIKTVSITAEAYEYVYFNENSQLEFVQLPNEQTIAIYTDDLKPKLKLVLRYYTTAAIDAPNATTIHVELYWADRIEYYISSGENNFTLVDEKAHFFTQVPVIHYINNAEGLGDFEKILPLINDYDKRLSDNSNELEYFRNAYLVISNMLGTDETDIAKAKETGAFLVSDNGKVEFITKNIDLSAVQDHLGTLEQNIHKFASIPNMTDESFASNSSGVSLKYKLWSFENLISAKERKLAKGLYKRLELISIALNLKGKNYDWREVTAKFTRNLPQNLTETADVVSKLNGIVPGEELLALLPFIEDPQVAAEALAQSGVEQQ